MALTLLAPGGCARLCAPRPAHIRHRVTTFATLSSPGGHAVDWVEATSSFFEQDARPIMLFDGMYACIILFVHIFCYNEIAFGFTLIP